MEEDSEPKPEKGEDDAVKDIAVAEAPVLDLNDQGGNSIGKESYQKTHGKSYPQFSLTHAQKGSFFTVSTGIHS